DRRVLESRRRSWTHAFKIARQRNKSRTRIDNAKTTPCTVALPKLRARSFDLTQHRVTSIPFDAAEGSISPEPG
ncbi:hypothetical protein, partial [Bradyrhizobium manausense]|uniref:hypothetical protein n=1 Tax=Bradyrhizobium manausense TaxID=989370 RepID=UPI00196AA552